MKGWCGWVTAGEEESDVGWGWEELVRIYFLQNPAGSSRILAQNCNDNGRRSVFFQLYRRLLKLVAVGIDWKMFFSEIFFVKMTLITNELHFYLPVFFPMQIDTCMCIHTYNVFEILLPTILISYFIRVSLYHEYFSYQRKSTHKKHSQAVHNITSKDIPKCISHLLLLLLLPFHYLAL